MNSKPKLNSVMIQGYKPFGEFLAKLGQLEVIVGANGSGKSSLFDFLKLLRDSVYQGTISSSAILGQQVLHGLKNSISWDIDVKLDKENQLSYKGTIGIRSGVIFIFHESVKTSLLKDEEPNVFMDINNRKGFVRASGSLAKRLKVNKQELNLDKINQVALNTVTSPIYVPVYDLRKYILDWRFYSSFYINSQNIRRPSFVEQEPFLQEDASNLSSLLHYLMTEHPFAFTELQQHLRSTIPGFKGLIVKARGAPGEVMAFWQENGIDKELSLAELSDGIIRLICWIALCIHPNPPSLICIDEPDLGVHPRTLPILAGLFEKACERTQIIIATHSSYFLTQFDISRIAVMRKENGEAKFIKPINSKVLRDNLEEFGKEEIEIMHRNDELEYFA